MASMQEKSILCSIKPTVSLLVGDHKHDFFSGCKMFDVTFPNIINPEIGEICFQNFYVAQLTIRAKFRSADLNGQTGTLKWRTCVRKMQLMPNAHTEDGSHDYFTLNRKHFNFDIVNLSTLRFILHQPSPVWKDFKLEDIRFYRSPQVSKSTGLPYWLTEEQTEEKAKDKQKLQGLPDLDMLSANLQALWSMAEEVSDNQSTVPLGRYEVDGCYDINLLSYT
ncbi:hypothetical protein LOTGIDRAFT_236344 [Lottia gigantea]|uniref:Nicolin-1 n=1 Tax=Lottia gigantea TaxID=225164 RepID=V3Z1J1_LOTGI|nr:hypothetical protein LOTGIDRAFT_236344 [Lottia gigantea]ESO84393.1 hypothetical protein LOTGIDRAFT_236344 [Lottia gigantea]